MKMLIRVLDENKVTVMWHGATFGFMETLNHSDISGSYFDQPGGAEGDGGAREYWRFMNGLDLREKMDLLQSILGDSGFYNTAMKIDVEPHNQAEGVVYDWIEGLKTKKHYRVTVS